MWPDNETTLDLLGFKVHADLIKSVVMDDKLLPITVGIFGDWGSGKTSIMKMLEHDLDPENYPEKSQERDRLNGVVCLYFNGWLFEGYDDAKSALLSTILIQLGKNKRFGPKVKESIVSLLESVDWMRLARLGFREVAVPALLAYLTGGVSLIPSIVDASKSLIGIGENKAGSGNESKIGWEDVLKGEGKKAGPMDVRMFRERFSKMLADSDIRSLVILIDDLDRCSPQRIIDNLEAIKLFLSVDRTAFVIGADPRIVRHAISSIYKPEEIRAESGEYEPQTDIVNDYLEKLIQVPYRLPRLSPAEVQTYMSLLFCNQALDSDAFGKLHAVYEKHCSEDRYSVFGYGAIQSAFGGTLLEELTTNLKFCASVSPLITEGLKGNPRQVKRFLNAYVLRRKLADVARLSNLKDDILVKLMVLEYTEPKRFNQLYKWQASQDGFPIEIKKLEQILCLPTGKLDNESDAKEVAAEWGGLFLRKWITIEPRLGEVDLRDYFWIARDRLQSTLSDVTLVPPFIRQLFDDLISDKPGRISTALHSTHEISTDEIDLLLALFEHHVEQYPDDKKGYDGLRLLIENDISKSAEMLAKLLTSIPPDSIPPAVGVDLLILIKVKPNLEDIFKSPLDYLRTTKSMIAAALLN